MRSERHRAGLSYADGEGGSYAFPVGVGSVLGYSNGLPVG